ncbi:hypothetical protein QBC42DRAFT_12296 [Cladorrhinum samala]|uniref:Uncharacterized protein n=1 Tax=Cladorrhinum samala TaxID=585594 RepID=A0AAV9HEN8_9PEZI|nr:hypothetical protein QBC42DRAFT_12296 [Cladorrhinum samala]
MSCLFFSFSPLLSHSQQVSLSFLHVLTLFRAGWLSCGILSVRLFCTILKSYIVYLFNGLMVFIMTVFFFPFFFFQQNSRQAFNMD